MWRSKSIGWLDLGLSITACGLPEPGLLPPLGVSPLSPARACPRRPRPACHRRCAVAAGSSHVQALCQLASMIGTSKQKQLVGVLETQPGRCRSGPVAAARVGAATRGGDTGRRHPRGSRQHVRCPLLHAADTRQAAQGPQPPTASNMGGMGAGSGTGRGALHRSRLVLARAEARQSGTRCQPQSSEQ